MDICKYVQKSHFEELPQEGFDLKNKMFHLRHVYFRPQHLVFYSNQPNPTQQLPSSKIEKHQHFQIHHQEPHETYAPNLIKHLI